MNGMYQLNPDEIDDPKLKTILGNDEHVYEWIQWNSRDMEAEISRDLKFIALFIDNEGPFDGLMGFSQGGSIINSLLQFHFSGKITMAHLPRFAIIINSPFFHLPIGKAQLDFPTLHFVSPQDYLAYGMPMLMTTFY